MPRVFTALRIPTAASEAMRRALTLTEDPATRPPDDARRGAEQAAQPQAGVRILSDLHLTLTFIGKVDDRELAALRQAFGAVRGARFLLSWADAGVFGPPEPPRTLWRGVQHHRELLRLQSAVASAGTAIGRAPERRTFVPHVTLARFKRADPDRVDALARRLSAVVLPPLAVDEFVLYESQLSSAGATYQVLERYALT